MNAVPLLSAAAVVLLAGSPAVSGELYKWVDERGITNYSSEPPPKSTNAKAVTLPEDRLSIYTPEESVTREIERAKERFARPREPLPGAPRMPEPDRRAVVPAPAPPAAYDPCANPGDPNCQASLYDRSPVFQGRRSPPVLVQPQLSPGTVAGNATMGSGTVPGLSGVAPAAGAPVRPITRSGPAHDAESPRENPRR